MYVPFLYNYCSESYAEAEKFLMQRRRINPPMYNANRLQELPIPEIPFDTNEHQSVDQGDNDEAALSESIEELYIQNDSANQEINSVEPNVESHDGSIQGEAEISAEQYNGNTGDMNDPLAISNKNTDSKIFIQIFEPNKEATDEIADLLNEKEVIEIDDSDGEDEPIFMIISSSGIPQPIQATVDGLVKQENDTVSANIAFVPKVNIFHPMYIYYYIHHDEPILSFFCRKMVIGYTRLDKKCSPSRKKRLIHSLCGMVMKNIRRWNMTNVFVMHCFL